MTDDGISTDGDMGKMVVTENVRSVLTNNSSISLLVA